MKKMCLVILILAVGMMAGCATTTTIDKAMWRGDWGEEVRWVAETRMDGDVPRTIIGTKNGTTLIFQ